MCRGECHLVDPIPEITRDSTRQLDLPGDQLPNRRDSVNLGQGKIVSLVRRLSGFTNWPVTVPSCLELGEQNWCRGDSTQCLVYGLTDLQVLHSNTCQVGDGELVI